MFAAAALEPQDRTRLTERLRPFHREGEASGRRARARRAHVPAVEDTGAPGGRSSSRDAAIRVEPPEARDRTARRAVLAPDPAAVPDLIEHAEQVRVVQLSRIGL